MSASSRSAAATAAQALAAGLVVRRAVDALRVVVGLCLAVAIAVVLAGIAPTYFSGESFTVYSGSMEPSIHVGALAVVRPVPQNQLKVGDVVTYRTPLQPDVLITHRLVAIERTEDGRLRFRTKGDANKVEDLVVVDEKAVLGKVIYSVPYAGYLVEFSKRPTGRALLVGLPALLLLLDVLRERINKRRREQLGPSTAPRTTPAGETERLRVLAVRGRQALEAGHADLAQRAADGMLAADPLSEEGWLLKVESAPDSETQRVLLGTALTLNPNAQRLRELQQSLAEGKASSDPSSDGAADAAG